MKTLNFTAQNVTIDQLASLTDRGSSACFLFHPGLYVHSCSLCCSSFPLKSFHLYPCYLDLWLLCWSLISPAMVHQENHGLKAKDNGSEARMSDYLVRWDFGRSTFIWLSEVWFDHDQFKSKSQRLGDMLSNTAVVKIKPTEVWPIRRVKDRSNHKIVQRGCSHGEEMLFLKTTLSKWKHQTEPLWSIGRTDDDHARAIENKSKRNESWVHSIADQWLYVMTR